MKLKSFTIVLLIGLAAIVMAAQFLISRSIVGGGFQELEMRHVARGITRAKKAILDELTRLDVFLWDWTSWDDTYEYVQDANEEYERSNLLPDTFMEQSLAAMVYRNRDGEVIFARAHDAEGEEDALLLETLLGELDRVELPRIPGEDSGYGGLLMLPQGPFLVARREVLTSAGEGPAMGTQLMARQLDEDMVAALADRLESAITAMPLPLPETMVNNEVLTALNALLEGEDVVVSLTDDDIAHGYAMLRDVEGQPALLLRERQQRRIHKHGRSVMLYNYGFLVLVIVLYSLLAYVLLQMRVLSRIVSLRRQVAAMGNSTGRIEISGGDEIAQLGQGVNSMLQRIEDTNREVERRTREIVQSEQFLNQLFNAVKAGIMLVDPETKTIVDINDFALELSGFSREEVEGRICHKLLCPSEENGCPFLDLGQSFDFSQRRLVTADGRVIPIMKSVSYIERDGRPLLLETFVDITEIEKAKQALEDARDELESKVMERTLELEQANSELVAMNKTKSLFLSSASHELRTPLTSILGFLKLMEKTFWNSFLPHLAEVEDLRAKTKRFGENLAVTRTEAERLGRLVNDLLDLNKIESGRMEWRDEPLLPAEILTNAASAISSLADEKKGVELRLEVSEGLPRVAADSDRIHQVLINLLQNAVKFTDKGSITLGATAAEGGVEFSVTDTGVGISREDHEQIFDIFYQAQSGDQRSSGPFGTGLGLAICKNILAHYGGEMHVESAPGRGSRFHFVLPIADGPPQSTK